MRIAVMGTGGVGGYFGARLAGGGQDVSFVARGRQLDALRRNGLRVQSPLGDVHLPEVVATDDPADLDPVDVVLFGVKLWDTEQAAAQLKPVLGEGAGLSGTTSLARTPIGPIRDNPRSRAFLHDVMDEVVQVARAQGVSLPVDYARDRLSFVDTVPAAMTSSMHHDLERGGRLEVAWLSGDVVARGAEAGVATPANRAVADLLAVHADGADR
jgi:ketopantoate reductase